MAVRRGEGWERPASGPADLDVVGDDAALAAWVASRPGARIRFHPTQSDLARAVGIADADAVDAAHGTDEVAEEASGLGLELAMDVLQLAGGDLACNMVVVGTPPDRLTRFSSRVALHVSVDGRSVFEGRATTVAIAVGQFLRGTDLVPRGHPGDGRAEIQIYRLRPAERRAMRARLATGDHVPHPRVVQRSGRQVAIEAEQPLGLEVDGRARAPIARVVVDLVPEAYSLVL